MRPGTAYCSRRLNETLVFIPAFNEADNLPAVLDELRAELPDVDVLVVDDGSTDRTADVAREHGAEVLSLGLNRGLPIGIAAGYAWALEHRYEFCGRVDADGQHPARELRRLLELVRAGACDVAVGSRFVSGEGYEPYRYRPSPARRLGTALLRHGMRKALQRLDAAGLRVDEVPVTMEERAGGVSKLRGKKAVKVTLTVIATLLAGRFLWSRTTSGGRPS